MPIFDLSFMRSFFKFGTYITFYNLMYYVSQSVEKFLIGRCDGTASLGYYTRSYTLLNVYERLFPSIVVQVLYPVLGKIKNDKEAISKVYYSALEVMFLVGGILMAIVGAWSEEFTSIIWGRQWGESALSLSILSFSAIAFTQIVLTRMVFISFYAENKLMHFSLFISVLTTVLCLLGNNADSSWVLRCGMDCVRCFGDVRRHLFGAGHGGKVFFDYGKILVCCFNFFVICVCAQVLFYRLFRNQHICVVASGSNAITSDAFCVSIRLRARAYIKIKRVRSWEWALNSNVAFS